MTQSAFTILSLATGTFIYGFYRVAAEPLVSGVPWWGKYPALSVLLLLFIACLFIWRKIVKQFKLDRTSLGFSPTANGNVILITYLVVAALMVIGWGFSSSRFH